MAASVDLAHADSVNDDDDDRFAEDECTMDFGDEEEAVKQDNNLLSSSLEINGYATLQQRHLMSCQFPGAEDFSRYLPDDDDVVNLPTLHPAAREYDGNSPPPLSVDPAMTTRRYRKKNEQTSTPMPPTALPAVGLRPQSSSPPPVPIRRGTASISVDDGERRGSLYTRTPSTQMSTSLSVPRSTDDPSLSGDTVADGVGRSKSISTIRDRLGRFLQKTTRKSNTRRSRQTEVGSGTLHDFSFADSKMASEFLHRDGVQSASDSPSSQLETQSDLGITGRAGWWDVGTLRSSRSGYSSSSSAAGSTLSRKTDSGGQGSTTVGTTLRGFFQRNRKSKSVPDLQLATDESYDSSSKLSATSSGGGVGNDKLSSANGSSAPASAAHLATTSSPRPPPLPPLRRPSRSQEGGTVDNQDERSQSRSRLADFWKKRKNGKPSVETTTPTAGHTRTSTERSRSAPRYQEESVSTLRYRRTNDEIPVTF